MSKKVISVICGLMTVSMLLTFVSCGKRDGQTEQSESDVVDNTGSQVETDENGFVLDSIPDDIDYGGKEVGIFGWSGGGETDFDTQSGTEVPAALYKRNVTVEERLGVKLRFDTSLNGGNANRAEYITSVETVLSGSTEYDLIAAYSMNAASLAMDGYLVDLGQKAQIQFEGKPWWSQDIFENAMINGKLYFASGPISPTLLFETMTILVNLDMCDEYLLEDPRYLAKDYKWTMDKMFEMSKNIGEDISGDGKDKTDKYGIVMSNVLVDGFVASNGIRYLDTSMDQTTGKEKLCIDEDFDNGLKAIGIIERISSELKTSDAWLTSYDESADVFSKGNALFLTGSFAVVKTTKDKIGFNYGYLPYPMADVDQQRYYSTSGFPYSMWGIPKASLDTDCAAYVMECLASESYRIVQPEIYETVQFKYSKDAINAEMFELIIGSMTYDYGRLFHNNFEYRRSPVFTFRGTITEGSNFTTNISSNRKHINGILDKINAMFS